MKITFCSSEVFPFAKTGGLGDVCGSLPLALEEIGIDVSMFMPGYRSIGHCGHTIEQLNGQVSRTTLGSNINVYFINDAHYFGRESLYGDSSGDYKDNIERFSYFCNQVLILLKQLDIGPDIVHCHDWQTALIPVYLKEKYRQDAYYTNMKTLLTIHNLAFQGIFPKAQYAKLGLNGKLLSSKSFEFHNQINLLKAGIIYSDMVTTVSPQYAKEIRTPKLGCGLENILKSRKNRIKGILNGLDDQIWDPQEDEFIAENYSKENCTQAKATNKVQLQKKLHLEPSKDIPLFGFVGRLSGQKGVDLILEVMGDLIQLGIQMIFLGVGESHYQNKLREMASSYPESVAVCFDFNEPLSHQIYAASDFFLMPSKFEPCGLSQMISLRYGTIPIVYKTGGLIDSVKSFSIVNKHGNGLVFHKHTAGAFLRVINKAVNIFRNPGQLDLLRQNALSADFSWNTSAHQYQENYQCV